MSYPRDLDEYTTPEILNELERRAKDASDDQCDYCHRAYGTPDCRMGDRHFGSDTVQKRLTSSPKTWKLLRAILQGG